MPIPNSRLAVEWSRTFDRYKMRWTIVDDSPIFRFHLPDQDLLVEVANSPFGRILPPGSEPTAQLPEHYLRVLPDGAFYLNRPRWTDGEDLLVWCPACGRYWFSLHRDSCPVDRCHNELWIQEQPGMASWFGFVGAEVPEPCNLDVAPPFWATPRPESLPTGDEDSEVDGEIAQPSRPALLDSRLFEPTTADRVALTANERWKDLRVRLSGSPREHRFVGPVDLSPLYRRYPNMVEILSLVEASLALAPLRKSSLVSLPRLLLIGEPSCGKTSLLASLGRVLFGDDVSRIDLGQGTTNFTLAGSDQQLRDARPGLILEAIAGCGKEPPVRNPLIIFDEVDKASHHQFNPLPVLLSVLETRTARSFTDEFFRVPVDVSVVQFFATANKEEEIPAALRSRFRVYQVPNYTEEQFVQTVVPEAYRDWLEEFHPGRMVPDLEPAFCQMAAEWSDGVARRLPDAFLRLMIENYLWPAITWETLVRPPGEFGLSPAQ